MHIPQRNIYLKALAQPCKTCGAQEQEECDNFADSLDRQCVCMARVARFLGGGGFFDRYCTTIPNYVTTHHEKRTFSV